MLNYLKSKLQKPTILQYKRSLSIKYLIFNKGQGKMNKREITIRGKRKPKSVMVDVLVESQNIFAHEIINREYFLYAKKKGDKRFKLISSVQGTSANAVVTDDTKIDYGTCTNRIHGIMFPESTAIKLKDELESNIEGVTIDLRPCDTKDMVTITHKNTGMRLGEVLRSKMQLVLSQLETIIDWQEIKSIDDAEFVDRPRIQEMKQVINNAQ